MTGDEAVRLVHLTADATPDFRLPGDRPSILVDFGEGEQDTEVALHSVVIQPDALRLDMIWRGAARYPGVEYLTQMRRMSARVA